MFFLNRDNSYFSEAYQQAAINLSLSSFNF